MMRNKTHDMLMAEATKAAESKGSSNAWAEYSRLKRKNDEAFRLGRTDGLTRQPKNPEQTIVNEGTLVPVRGRTAADGP